LDLSKIGEEESTSESDDNEQALISAREWRSALKRISQLETKVSQLQTLMDNGGGSGIKRPREEEQEQGSKQKKPRYK
jgi:hypothetical protein